MTEQKPKSPKGKEHESGMTPAMRKAFEESFKRNEEALRRLAKL